MYIACEKKNNTLKFYIRESYREKGILVFRNLMEMEAHPGSYITYIQERAFYIDEVVEDTIKSNTGLPVDSDRLEEIFWPYVKPEIRRRFEFSRSRTTGRTKTEFSNKEVHLFDKRRLHYLKSGLMNQGRLENAPLNLFQIVTGKSRDEIEQFFISEESILKPMELKSYVYVIFDLNRYFNKIFAREMPHVLNEDEIAMYFLNDICVLNQDTKFWEGMKDQRFLREYLKRYVIMFFDSDFGEPSFFEDILSRRMHGRRYHRQMKRPREHVMSDASLVFGIPERELQNMTKRELTKMYRRKAREYHPDSGGSHEQFVKLSNVYDELMEKN